MIRLSRYGPAQGLASALVTALATARGPGGEQQLYAATRDAGLFRLEGERFVPVYLGSAVTEVYALLGGGDGDPGALWVGTRTAGLLRLESPAWVALDRTSGLPADQALGLLETAEADGRPVYGSAPGKASR